VRRQLPVCRGDDNRGPRRYRHDRGTASVRPVSAVVAGSQREGPVPSSASDPGPVDAV